MIPELDALVNKLDATYRGRTDVLRPTTAIPAGPGHYSLGLLDVLGGRDYESLLPGDVLRRAPVDDVEIVCRYGGSLSYRCEQTDDDELNVARRSTRSFC